MEEAGGLQSMAEIIFKLKEDKAPGSYVEPPKASAQFVGACSFFPFPECTRAFPCHLAGYCQHFYRGQITQSPLLL